MITVVDQMGRKIDPSSILLEPKPAPTLQLGAQQLLLAQQAVFVWQEAFRAGACRI